MIGIWRCAVFTLILLSSSVAFGFVRMPPTTRHSRGVRLEKMIAGLNKNDFESMMKGGKRSLADLLGNAKSQQLRSAVASPTQNNNSPTDQGNNAPTQELNKKGSPFVRIVNIRRIPRGKPVRCRLLAKENERTFIADQLNVVGIAVLTANVTLSLLEGDQTGVQVSGDVFVQLEDPFVTLAADSTSTSDGDDSSLDQTGDDDSPLRFDDLDDDLFAIRTSFVSKLFFDPSAAILEKASRTSKQGKARERLLDFNHVDDFDDEIPPSGDIDIGDIVLQYLSMEISG